MDDRGEPPDQDHEKPKLHNGHEKITKNAALALDEYIRNLLMDISGKENRRKPLYHAL